jgi:outer membrane biosynthesis protein TonB
VQTCDQNIQMKGKLVVALVIDINGRVRNVKMISSELKNNKVEQCIIDIIKKLTFPVKQGNLMKTKAHVSFIFSS